MSIKKPFPIVFYQEPSKQNKSPVREWLKKNFNREELKKIGHNIMVVQYRWPLGMPLVKNLDKGLWELRIAVCDRIVRLLFTIDDDVIILLHGFIKKTQKTPQKELILTQQRKRNLENEKK